MGRSAEQLTTSEVLPGFGAHNIIFHNGKGYYYTCKDYLSPLYKRVFRCVRQDCDVTAAMGPGLETPLVDRGKHCHAADLDYRDKCIILHVIQQRFLQEATSPFTILRDVLSSLSPEESPAACEASEIITTEEDPILSVIKTEALDEDYTVSEGYDPGEALRELTGDQVSTERDSSQNLPERMEFVAVKEEQSDSEDRGSNHHSEDRAVTQVNLRLEPPRRAPPAKLFPSASTTQAVIHVPSKREKNRMRICSVCSTKEKRRTTSLCCRSCPGEPGLCGTKCFEEYHKRLKILEPVYIKRDESKKHHLTVHEKEGFSKKCRVCVAKGDRNVYSRFICPTCPGRPSLCAIGCFEEFHDSLKPS